MNSLLLSIYIYNLLVKRTDLITLRLKLEDDFFLMTANLNHEKNNNNKSPKEDLADTHKTLDNQKNRL